MNPILNTSAGILLPFLGTALGAGAVYFLKSSPGDALRKTLYGFAAGVMLASLVWSLLIPALEMTSSPFPAPTGFLLGMGIFIFLDSPKVGLSSFSRLSGNGKLFAAVTLHNLPEGMAVGVAFAVALTSPEFTARSAFVLSVGIALQNFPEGAIISMPLSATGLGKGKSFFWGVASGAVEPAGAVLSLLLTHFVRWLLPYVLSFAAGAMLYVVAEEILPSLAGEKGKSAGLWSVAAGFAVMMLMDVALG